jgi:hypothetical protein
LEISEISEFSEFSEFSEKLPPEGGNKENRRPCERVARF